MKTAMEKWRWPFCLCGVLPPPDASDAIPAHANSDTATDARAELAEQVTTALAVVVAVAIVCSIAMLLGTT